MEKYVASLIIYFFIYAFAGWLWESFLLPVLTRHKIKNSGFLNGPIVPIYGVGAITVSLLFSANESYLSIFIEGAFVACVIEYLTSWGMEKLYHRRWWDYSDKAFHVNGRVCLEGFLVFGLFSVIAVKYTQPFLLSWLNQYSMVLLIIIATAFSTLLIIDFCITIKKLMNLEEHMEELMKDIENYARGAFDEFDKYRNDMIELIDMMKKSDKEFYKTVYKHKRYTDRRIMKAFPHLINKKKKPGGQ